MSLVRNVTRSTSISLNFVEQLCCRKSGVPVVPQPKWSTTNRIENPLVRHSVGVSMINTPLVQHFVDLMGTQFFDNQVIEQLSNSWDVDHLGCRTSGNPLVRQSISSTNCLTIGMSIIWVLEQVGCRTSWM